MELNYAITLLNPFTGKVLYLRPIMEAEDYDLLLFSGYEYGVQKVILSADPMLEGSIIAKSPQSMEMVRYDANDEAYIVESTVGDLVLVIRYVGNKVDKSQMVALAFHVYKLYQGPHLTYWTGVDTLDGDVQFLSDNHSLAVSAHVFAGSQLDSIYYADDCYTGETTYTNVFNLKDECSGLHCSLDTWDKEQATAYLGFTNVARKVEEQKSAARVVVGREFSSVLDLWVGYYPTFIPIVWLAITADSTVGVDESAKVEEFRASLRGPSWWLWCYVGNSSSIAEDSTTGVGSVGFLVTESLFLSSFVDVEEDDDGDDADGGEYGREGSCDEFGGCGFGFGGLGEGEGEGGNVGREGCGGRGGRWWWWGGEGMKEWGLVGGGRGAG
ncbi:hypothetical protein RJ640_008951 [Escallonia rubra]|uniref:KIB1-4 beta-propeller domain-containing protein n=1 Tax=Escallonia rubra TaxID=112253 RepID=A0AA88RDY9_9ASTE|nr:hypothetical protein RJ640_008951 [Escallonia rubra]